MNLIITTLLALFIGLPSMAVSTAAGAADDKAIKAERSEAQKQRQQQKNERNKQNQAALSEFRAYARELKKEYQEKVRDLDTEYRLQRVGLKAERDGKIADVEAEMQQNISQLYLNPQQGDSQASIEKLKQDMKQHADKVFEIKKQAALDEHEEEMANELRKHEAMTERDEKARAKAESLGLLTKPKPILAKAIGGTLTDQEQRWNEREQKEVERLYESNKRQFGEFGYGAELREFDMKNKREDFKLHWQKKSELHANNSEQTYLNPLFAGAAADSGADAQARQQEMMKQMSEISKKNRHTNIKYSKIDAENRIKRGDARRKILGR